MAHPMDDLSLSNTIPDIEAYISTALSFQEKSITTSSQKDYSTEIITAINETIRLAMKGEIPTEVEAKRQALFAEMNADTNDVDHLDGGASDKVFSFRVEFSGFLFSLVDSAPSEIALVSLRNINALARWNRLRSTDATLLLSIGWLQVDNHIPSAPFKVAVRPDLPRQQEEEGGQDSSPLLVVAVAFAPEHKSKIVVLRSVTIAPRDLVIALDLAFLVRVLRFFSGRLALIAGHSAAPAPPASAPAPPPPPPESRQSVSRVRCARGRRVRRLSTAWCMGYRASRCRSAGKSLARGRPAV